VHLDFKPDNIIVKLNSGSPIPFVIDFGSMREIGCDKSDILCTYPFCAPEALKPGAIPTTACDAYSFGATIYEYIYKKTLYDFWEYPNAIDVVYMHKHIGVELPSVCPESCPKEIFDLMIGLLNPVPSKRTKISEAYHILADVIDIFDPPKTFTLRPVSPVSEVWKNRPEMIDWMYKSYKHTESIPLALNYLDRFAAETKSAPTTDQVKAAYTLAYTTMFPQDYPVRNPSIRDAITQVANVLNYELYSDTLDTILVKEYGIRSDQINEAVLVSVLKESWGITSRAVNKYMQMINSSSAGHTSKKRRRN
jgi:serine/threonine protein kinase